MAGAFLIGCAANELVMPKGMVIDASTPDSQLRIEATENMERVFIFDGHQYMVQLLPRWERWFGNYGAGSPGGGRSIHLVVEEAQQHFCSSQEAMEWLNWKNYQKNLAYRKDGLVVGWRPSSSSDGLHRALSVEVWQVYINGKIESDVLKSDFNSLGVSFSPSFDGKFPEVGDFVPSQPRVIDGRLYSGRAIDILKERSINPIDINNIIRSSELRARDGYYYVDGKCGSHHCYIRVDESGRVMQIIW